MKLGKEGTKSFLLLLTMLLLLPYLVHGSAENIKALDPVIPQLIVHDGWLHTVASSNLEATNPSNKNYQKAVTANLDFVMHKDRTRVTYPNLLSIKSLSHSPIIQTKQIYLRPASPYMFYYEDRSKMQVEDTKVYALAPENTSPVVKKRRYRSNKRRFPLRESSKMPKFRSTYQYLNK